MIFTSNSYQRDYRLEKEKASIFLLKELIKVSPFLTGNAKIIGVLFGDPHKESEGRQSFFCILQKEVPN
jgi:hypothetical protein